MEDKELSGEVLDPSDKTEKERGFIASLPLFVKIFYICAAVSVLLFAAYIISEPFADFFNRHISSVLRAALSYATGWIPFSFAEFFLIMLPVTLGVVIYFATKYYCDRWRDVLIYCTSLLSVLALFFSVFTVGFAAGYHGTTLDKKLGIERKEVSADELYDTAMILVEKLSEESVNQFFGANGFSVMPYDYTEMNEKLINAYDKACEKYAFIQKLDSRLKRVMLSEAMSYTHITGVYSFFTGEANINVAFPDYTVPYTAAHELAHQRGIAREDEANFVAYLVCIDSDDAYIRYSAYLNLFEYVSSALYSADAEMYAEVMSVLEGDVRREMVAFSSFFDKYRDSVASEVSGTINDTYLTIQGTAGTASYGMVVDLAVAYYKSK